MVLVSRGLLLIWTYVPFTPLPQEAGLDDGHINHARDVGKGLGPGGDVVEEELAVLGLGGDVPVGGAIPDARHEGHALGAVVLRQRLEVADERLVVLPRDDLDVEEDGVGPVELGVGDGARVVGALEDFLVRREARRRGAVDGDGGSYDVRETHCDQVLGSGWCRYCRCFSSSSFFWLRECG